MPTDAKIPSSSEKASSPGVGCSRLGGVFLILIGIPLIPIIIGIVLIGIGIAMLSGAEKTSKKVFKCTCPYCSNSYIVNMSVQTYFDCPKCGERVIYSEGKFYTKEEFKNKKLITDH
jgi:ribosomal protein S27E